MKPASQINTDYQLRQRVLEQLDWEPEVIATEIGVSVSEGVITLTGFVNSFAEKIAAERIVRAVRGVRGIANDILVRPGQLTDTEIVKNAVHALASNVKVPAEQITVTVQDGLVTLCGVVAWAFQKDAAAAAIKDLLGVRAVFNEIEIEPTSSPLAIEEEIASAIGRSDYFDEHRIQIEAEEGVVTLSGHVSSITERAEAERLAWSAKGVTEVINRILVAPLQTA